MVDFAVHAGPLIEAGIKVAAASVDSVEDVKSLREGLRVGYRMYADIDAAAVADATGAHLQSGERTFLHATAFLVDPEGVIANAIYSTGPIGRFTASEVIRKVLFERNLRDG